MATTRARQLEKLAMSLPQANQQAAQAQQAARTVQLQEQLRGVRPGAGSTAFAQQVGAQQAARAGQIQTEAAQRTQQQQQLVAQEGLAEEARGQRQAGVTQQITLTQAQRGAADRLARIDRTMKNRLLDEQLQFRRDQAGRTLLNERQLVDWAATKARSAEEYAEYAQAAQQMYERDIQMLQVAHLKISQALTQNQVAEGKPLDRELRKKLTSQKRNLEVSIQNKQNKAANKAAMVQAGGSIVGAVVGGVIGSVVPGAGTVAGAAIGTSVGAGVASGVASIFGE